MEMEIDRMSSPHKKTVVISKSGSWAATGSGGGHTTGPSVNRRTMLAGGAAALSFWGLSSRPVSAGNKDPRFLFIILRGGLDGLSLAAPAGDPAYQALRASLALQRNSVTGAGAFDLDSLFVLNQNMPALAEMYRQREALIIHAVHTPYRERSHFDGQDILESGYPAMASFSSGWLNRALSEIPAAGRAEPQPGLISPSEQGLAMGAVVPLVLRGPASVLSWIPKVYPSVLSTDTIARLLRLYGHTDPALAAALGQGIEAERIAGTAARSIANPFTEFTEPAAVAARYLVQPGGPRIGALAYDGWDTHAAMGTVNGALARKLTGLDHALATLKQGLGDAWKDTAVVVASEFGRTVEVNGSLGTDHGMATVALLVGGAVNGGRVIADWPGLQPKALHEGRDLTPTTDLRAVLKGILRDHLGLPDGLLAERVFPDSTKVKPIGDLMA
jgi:uncharacterized protein (DUF1501 family)